MHKKYQAKCQCGTSILVETAENCSHLRLYCARCRKLIFDYQQQHQSSEQAPAQSGNKEQEQKVRFDEYFITKLLGRGSVGKVYLATHQQTREEVALKILKKPNEQRALDYFIRETQVLMQLRHPNITALKKWGNYQGYPFFTMEYVPGYTLADWMKKNALNTNQAIQICVYVLEALQYAREFNIIHRDIKPKNIMITPSGQVKVLDFGIGKIMEEAGELSETGQMIGTGYYMPPEQFQDAKRVDHRADVYGTGATLYHLLTGKPPFEEHTGSMLQLLEAKVQDHYIRLAQLRPELPEQLVAIVEKAMAETREKRYSDAHEMKTALMEFYKNNVHKKSP